MKFLSVNSIVTAPANTGSDNNNRIDVTNTDHTNRGSLCRLIPGARMFRIVVMKFIAPRSDDTPDKWRLKIAKSTDAPECDWILDRGGYHLKIV